jgi:phosphoribosylformimino-5-aminoimidazole carboxamide ribotide isomerase
MIIIPAIDIYDNSVVRLAKGDFNNITYYKNSPLQQALLYESFGFKIIHVVDLLGSKQGKFTSLESIKSIKGKTKLKVEFGGGIRDVKSAEELFSIGVDNIIIGSLSIKNKNEFELILSKNDPDNIIVAVDILDRNVKVSGWTEDTSISIYSHIEYCQNLGVNKFLCTDISRDGMLIGTNLELYQDLISRFPKIKLIASGGIKDINDVKNLLKINPYAVVVGKAIYEEKIDLKELAQIAL